MCPVVIELMLVLKHFVYGHMFWKSFKMRIHFSLKSDLNASMWHIYKMCTETGTLAGWSVQYSAVHWPWSRLASVSLLA